MKPKAVANQVEILKLDVRETSYFAVASLHIGEVVQNLIRQHCLW